MATRRCVTPIRSLRFRLTTSRWGWETRTPGCFIVIFTGPATHPPFPWSLRLPTAQYIVTANEGDDKEYGSYEEKTKLKDLISENGCLFPEAHPSQTDEKTDASGYAAGATEITMNAAVTLAVGDFVCGEYFAPGTTVTETVTGGTTVKLSAGLATAIPASNEDVVFTSKANGELMTVASGVLAQANALRLVVLKIYQLQRQIKTPPRRDLTPTAPPLRRPTAYHYQGRGLKAQDYHWI